jgi:hypothetical protein
MSASPYRESSAPKEDRASIAYPTVPPPRLLFRAYVVLIAAVFAAAMWAIAGSAVAGVLSFAGVVVAMFFWRSRRNATTSIDIEGQVLTLRAPRQEQVTFTLTDLLDVKIETSELVAASNVTPGPGFGTPYETGGVSFESKIGFVVRGHGEPLYLRSPRQSMTETSEEYPRIVSFLRAQGWQPENERA